MNISTLEDLVDDLNRWAQIFGSEPVSLLNPEDRQRIADHIDSQLSPENLTCDGELSGPAVRLQLDRLRRCAEELLTIDPNVEFHEFG